MELCNTPGGQAAKCSGQAAKYSGQAAKYSGQAAKYTRTRDGVQQRPAPTTRQHDYDDIPGTTVFDAQQRRR